MGIALLIDVEILSVSLYAYARIVDEALFGPVRQSIPAILASLAPWGVGAAHCLPGPDGCPVLWLAVDTNNQRALIERQKWLGSQVHVLLLRNGVPSARISDVKVMFDSQESIDRLTDSL
jgi:hypothetical protein